MDKTLAEIQAEFTGYLRNPSAIAIPDDLPAEPMRIYSSLVFRNVQSLLTSNFPVLAEITQKNGHWDALTQEFIRDHKAQTPHFPLLANEFLDYLDTLEEDTNKPEHWLLSRYPFAKELAHYEWVELDVQIAEVPPLPKSTKPIILSDELLLNPTAHVLAYRWPVHQIGPDFQPLEAPQVPTFLAVFQNPQIRSEFVLLTPLAALLLENIQLQPNCAAKDHIHTLEKQYEKIGETNLTDGVIEILEKLCTQGLVLRA